MSKTILEDIKILMPIPLEETSFDSMLLIYIESAFSSLHDVGVKMSTLSCDAESTWQSVFPHFDEQNIKNIRTYVYIETKLLLDPPTIGAVMAVFKEKSAETLWRISSNVKMVEKEVKSE